MSAAAALLADLHFMRPDWLWALLVLPVGAWAWQRRQRRADIWRSAVDAHLLPHLVEGGAVARRHGPLWLAMAACVLAVAALAGPSVRQVEQPLWQNRMPLVVALDLSRATLATDLPPSRLAQARAKLAALLRERNDGQVGLVAFAEDAFTVSPLTADPANVAIFLDALHPDIMPVDGHRPERAIDAAAQLLRQAGFQRGQVLVLTDGAGPRALDAAARAQAAGYRVSVLGIGGGGGRYTRVDGSLASAQLDEAALGRLADAGGGRYARLTADSTDLRQLDVLDPPQAAVDARTGLQGRTWVDDGYWLLPPLMLLGLWGLRRRAGGAMAVVCVVACALAVPATPAFAQQAAPARTSAQAADPAPGGWWQRADQARHARLREGTQAYRAGEFDRAAALYRQVDTADGHYNRGNALAKSGRYEDALAAYDRALALQPGMPDAQANRQAVQAAMKRRPPSGGNSGRDRQPPRPDDSGSPSPGAGDPGEGRSGSPQDDADGDGTADVDPPPGDRASTPPSSADPQDEARARAQREADAAQRERMQRALQQAGRDPTRDDGPEPPPAGETPAQREQRLANEAWLRRVPDDPGGLLREKFRLEHERRRIRGLRGE